MPLTTKIVTQNAPILHKKAALVPVHEIASIKIKNIVNRMKKALQKTEHGVAIAAPQIGESLQIFVTYKAPDTTVTRQKDGSLDIQKNDFLVFINPNIVKKSRKKNLMSEGCLSVPGIWGQTNRHEKVTIRAYDEKGKLFIRGASGLMAQIMQHETDHLNGILFIDHANNIEKIA